MRENLIENESFKFAILITQLYKDLVENKKEFILSKQLLKSGTSVGANVREALNAQSKKDFLSKMNIALKEVNESRYWIELLIEAKYIDGEKASDSLAKSNEIYKILSSIVKTTKQRLI